jgi:membrane protein DedA with SNARE-associated domain
MSTALNNFLLHYSYFAIFILSFISSMGIPAGSEVAIIGGGALASGEVHKLLSNGDPSSAFFHLSLVVVILLALGGEFLGSIVGYLIGRKGGRVAVDRWGTYLLLTHKDLDRAEAWFDRHGDPLVLFGRFIPLLRSFVSFAAGLAEMAVRKFLLFTVIGSARVLARRHLRQCAEEVQLRHLRRCRPRRGGRSAAHLAPGAHNAPGTNLSRKHP